MACMCLCSHYNVHSQNPNWVMPGGKFQPDVPDYVPLPNNPAWPANYQVGDINFDWNFKYTGSPAQYTQAGYTGPDGELMCFVVDDKLYDKHGWLVNSLRAQVNSSNNLGGVKGYSEMLILPMGNSCTRFAIIYVGSWNNNFNQLNKLDIFMGVYNTQLINTLNPFAIGALEGQGEEGINPTLQNISEYYAQHHTVAGEGSFTNASGYLIASTPLINNCFRYVILCDGKYIYRYKLDQSGLHYDNYQYQFQEIGGANTTSIRSEMELIKLNNGNYRLAIPAAQNTTSIGRSVRILDLDPNMQVFNGSAQTIDLTSGANNWVNVHGVEFSPNGRYVYFTHETSPFWTKPLDIWDVNTQSLLPNAQFPASLNPFKQSYIERSGNNLYLASDNFIGRFTNANNPDPSNFNPQFQAIAPGYGNNLNSPTSITEFRYLLPDQVDDDTYGNFEDFSCDCCLANAQNSIAKYQSDGSAVWTPSNNPLNGNSGPNVYVREELRIRAGDVINIDNMVFHFAPGAKVVVERGDGSANGAHLTLIRTTFTVDNYCADKLYGGCAGTNNGCLKGRWDGVIVEGHANQAQSDYGGTQQGRFSMRNNSFIEFAKTAIHADGAQGKGGGELNLRNSTIKDNVRGVWLSDYSWEHFPGVEVPNSSVIQRMTFVTTSDFSQVPFTTPNQHLRLSNIASLTVQGCNFSNQASFNPTFDNAGAGIYAANSGLKVTWICDQPVQGPCQGTITRSAFTKLRYAIGVYNVNNVARKVHIGFTQIDNVRSGIILGQTINAEVLDNDITLNNNAVGFPSEVVGLQMASSTGYAVENNHFQFNSLNNSTTGIGIVNTSSGEAPNEIYRNTFSGLDFGIFTRGINANFVPSQPTLSHPGLVFKCNQFRAPIKHADIYVNSGNINIFQGSCAQSNGAANNCFSHSGPNHFDFRLESASLNPLNQEINYRYDTPGPECLEPINVTQINTGSHVLPSPCISQYNDREQCQVRKSADPRVVREIRLVERMEENGASAEDVIGFIAATANTLEIQVEEQAAQFDNGLTAQIADLIVSGASDEAINELIGSIEGPLSHTLNMLIFPSDLAAISASSTMDAMDAEVASGFSDAELSWMAARAQVAEFWNDVVDFFQVDTTGALPAAELYALLDTYKPQGFDRMAGALAHKMGLAEPSWTTAFNSASTLSAQAISLATEEGELPFELPEMYNDDFFNSLSNVTALNEMYTSQYQAYIPSISFTGSFPASDESKSAQVDPQQDYSKGILAYPNPFTSEISLMLSEQFVGYTDLQVQFFDLTGRLVQQSRHGNGDRIITIDGQQFPAGMLFYTVRVDGVQVHSGKLMHVK